MAIVNVVPGTVTTGLWCPKCLKPSGYAAALHCLTPHGVTSIKCSDCGAPLSEGAP